MKRIINGFTYNTETSIRVAQSEWTDDYGDKAEVTSTLYQTRGGAFFLHHLKKTEEWNEREAQHQEKIRHEVEPVSADFAQKWMLDDTEVFTNPFGDPPEASAEPDKGATIYVRVPTALKHRVDSMAKAEAVSGNAWAMRCIERCLDPNPEAVESLKSAWNGAGMLFAHDDLLTSKQRSAMADRIREKIVDAFRALGWDRDDEGRKLVGHHLTDNWGGERCAEEWVRDFPLDSTNPDDH